MITKILILSGLLIFLVGIVAFAIWRTVKVLNPLASLLLEPCYSWDVVHNLRNLSGTWGGERITFTKHYTNPATFFVTLYRNTALPNIEVRNRKGEVVVYQVEEVCSIFRKVNFSLTEDELKAMSNKSDGRYKDIKRFFSSRRLELAHELLSSCKLDVIIIANDSIGVRSECYKLWDSIARKESVEKILIILQQIAKASD